MSSSNSWAEAAEKLGFSRRSGDRVKTLAAQAGLVTDHLVSHMDPVPKPDGYTFSQSHADRLTHRRAAIGIAINWFLQHGYPTLLPVEQEHYDLVVETPEGFRKIQVKSSEATPRTKAVVKLVRTYYDPQQRKHTQAPYSDGDVDDFFIVCSDGSRYLIPYSSVKGLSNLSLTDKYSAFKI